MQDTTPSMFNGPKTGDEEVLTTDLASLACRAAIEIDNRVLGRSQQMETVTRLADQMSSLVDRLQSNSSILHLDPTAVVLMKRAIEDYAVGSAPLSTVDELVDKAKIIQRSLKQLLRERQPDQEQLAKMRSFCLSLSESASSYQQSIDDLRQPHSYWSE